MTARSIARTGCACILVFAVHVALGQGDQADRSSHTLMISLPDKPWGVSVDLTGFNVTRSEMEPDGRRYVLADNPTTGVIFSTFLEETPAGGKANGCEDSLRARLRKYDAMVADRDIRTVDDKTILDFRIDKDLPAPQGNRFICQFYDNVFIDIHLSKMDFKKDDSKLFDQIVDSVSIHQGSARSSLDYMKEGSVYYLKHDYERAIPPYAEALALEKQNRQLDKNLWYALVDNLGMAYGITGDLEKSREVFEFGIRTDPDYPLFYYNMACYYGEKRDTNNVLIYLQKAFDRKANTIPGEGMPDPLTDDSFTPLFKDKDFKAKVAAIAKGS